MDKKKLIIVIVAIVLLIAIGVGVWYFLIRAEETPDTDDGDDKNESKKDGKLDKGEALELAGGLLSDLGKKL